MIVKTDKAERYLKKRFGDKHTLESVFGNSAEMMRVFVAGSSSGDALLQLIAADLDEQDGGSSIEDLGDQIVRQFSGWAACWNLGLGITVLLKAIGANEDLTNHIFIQMQLKNVLYRDTYVTGTWSMYDPYDRLCVATELICENMGEYTKRIKEFETKFRKVRPDLID